MKKLCLFVMGCILVILVGCHSKKEETEQIEPFPILSHFLNMVDEKKLSLVNGVDISYFDKEVQKWLYEYIKENGFIKPTQIDALKNHPNLENVTQYTLMALLNDALPEKKSCGKVALSERKLDKYFPPHFSARKREEIILKLLAEWKQENYPEEASGKGAMCL